MEDETIGIVVKIIAMILMFCIIGIFGSIPLRLYVQIFFRKPSLISFFRKSFKANPRVLSYSKAFSGGLFLAVGLVHLLPEVKLYKKKLLYLFLKHRQTKILQNILKSNKEKQMKIKNFFC